MKNESLRLRRSIETLKNTVESGYTLTAETDEIITTVDSIKNRVKVLEDNPSGVDLGNYYTKTQVEEIIPSDVSDLNDTQNLLVSDALNTRLVITNIFTYTL